MHTIISQVYKHKTYADSKRHGLECGVGGKVWLSSKLNQAHWNIIKVVVP